MKTPEEKKANREKRERTGEQKERTGEKGGGKIDSKIVGKTARTMWRIANAEKLEGVATADRRTAFAGEKAAYIDHARKLLRTLRKDGVEFTMNPKATDDEADLGEPLDKEPDAS